MNGWLDLLRVIITSAASALAHAPRRGDGSQLKKRITSRAMRRTFQDLARNADIEAIVRQKICGHATQEMSELYSTVPQLQAAVGARIRMQLAEPAGVDVRGVDDRLVQARAGAQQII